MIAAIEKAGHHVVAVGPEDALHGAIESRAESALCADVFRKHAAHIDGIVVTLPNFGDERAIADPLRGAALPVPVLIQATPDTPGLMTITHRRDSFCGKMSACNNLTQYGIPYSLTTLPTRGRRAGPLVAPRGPMGSPRGPAAGWPAWCSAHPIYTGARTADRAGWRVPTIPDR